MGFNDNERDDILWNQFKEGDETAFAIVFRRYYSPLFNYGCKISANHNLVEDCIQELFVELWRSGGKANIISLKAYVFQAFKFKLVKLINKDNKAKALSEAIPENAFVVSHEMLLINNEQYSALNKKMFDAFDQLSPRQREIIYLKFYQNLSYEAVASIMNINYQAARNLIYQSIKVLKKIIALYIVSLTFN
ncbi:MAG: sigma-70 family RNA polymerase sigma factor [Ferruginibacter sp.]